MNNLNLNEFNFYYCLSALLVGIFFTHRFYYGDLTFFQVVLGSWIGALIGYTLGKLAFGIFILCALDYVN